MRRRAFSLVELLVVVAIVGVVAAIALPRYGASLGRYRAAAAADRVSADIAQAAAMARATSARTGLRFSTSDNTYCLITFDSDGDAIEADLGSKKKGAAELSTFVVCLADEPYGARIDSVSFGGGKDLVFDGFGQPEAGGAVVVAAGDTQVAVAVEVGGGKVWATEPVVVEPDEPEGILGGILGILGL